MGVGETIDIVQRLLVALACSRRFIVPRIVELRLCTLGIVVVNASRIGHMAKAIQQTHPKLVFREREEGVAAKFTKGKTGHLRETQVRSL